jgi:hypothetical protein
MVKPIGHVQKLKAGHHRWHEFMLSDEARLCSVRYQMAAL